MKRYDVVIIGSGPAGLEAAVNLKIRNKNFLLFGDPDLSKKLEAAPRIDNFLGFPGISGQALKEKFLRHLEAMEIGILEEQIYTVYPMGDYYSLASSKNTYEASAVILATGTFSGNLLEGEEQFLGRGVGYCATCDAPLYKGRDVAILGYNEESVLDANYVAELAKTVYYIPMVKNLPLPEQPVRVLHDRPVRIQGGMKATHLVLEQQTLAVDGIFVLRDTVAPSSLVPGIGLEDGFVRVDAGMATSLPGCFAAGDITGKPHQYMRAAGQGQTAALSAVTYLAHLQKGRNVT